MTIAEREKVSLCRAPLENPLVRRAFASFHHQPHKCAQTDASRRKNDEVRSISGIKAWFKVCLASETLINDDQVLTVGCRGNTRAS